MEPCPGACCCPGETPPLFEDCGPRFGLILNPGGGPGDPPPPVMPGGTLNPGGPPFI